MCFFLNFVCSQGSLNEICEFDPPLKPFCFDETGICMLNLIQCDSLYIPFNVESRQLSY